MRKVFAFLSKRADLDMEQFINYYENHHVPLALSLATPPRVYKRNYVVRGDQYNREDPSIDFDVVSELVFDDEAAFLKFVQTLAVPEMAEDEARFLDRSRTRAYVVDEHSTTS